MVGRDDDSVTFEHMDGTRSTYTLLERCRCMDRHERGSDAYTRCPLQADGDHGYCMTCHPDTRRDQIRQAVIHGAAGAGLSIELAVSTYDDMVRG